MKCPNCDNENREGAKYCDECGFPLSDAILKAAFEQKENDSDSETPDEESDEKDYGSESDDKMDSDEEISEFPTEVMPAVSEEQERTSGIVGFDEDDPFENLTGEYTVDESEWEEADDESTEGDPSSDEYAEDIDGGELSPDVTIAFSDYMLDSDKTLVGDGYAKPESNWRDGQTMVMEPVGGEEEPRKRDFLASSTVKNPRNKRIAIIVAIVVVVVAIAIAAAYALEIWGGKSIPDVTGLTEAEATAMLEEEGFAVKPMQVRSDDTEGLVLVMDPSAGSRAEKGSEILIHVATARLIPDIVGKKKEQAAEMLEESGFVNVTYTEERSSKPEGEVIAVAPEAGKRAKSSDEVTVTTAKPYMVPDISDKYLSDAEAAIEEEGLVPAVEYVYTEDYPDGVIMGTAPPAGTEVVEGSTVTIQIARSREAECIALTQAYLAPGSQINVGLYGYEIESIESLTYMGDSTVAYSITARPFITGFGETAYFSAQPVAGQIVWTAANTIASMT